ncbi:MAG TPA: M56 family metallopeptidase [Syntrophomonas sp.]|nr:M56 family metallopeptidase [Syntrophomonas sp.]
MGNLLSNLLAMSIAGSVVVGLLLLLRPITVKIFPAKWQYGIGKMAIAFFLLPVFLFAKNLPLVQPVIESYPAEPSTIQKALPELPSNSFVDAMDTLMEKHLTVELIQAVLFIWLVGTMVFAGWHFYCYRRFSKQLRTDSFPVPDDTATAVLLSSCKAALGIRGEVKLMQNCKIASPMLVGLRRSMILLPASNMPEIDLKLVLTHELTHLKRKDLWVKMFALATGTLHWFNPLAYVLRKDISTWGELSCDEALASEMSREERKLYGEAILNTLDNHSGMNTAFCSSLCESRKHIERRLTMVLNVKKMKKHIAVFAVAAILVIGATGIAVAAYAADNTSYNDSQEPIIKTTGATITPSSVDFGTHLDVELTKGGAFVVGRETWDKGDEIIFRISTDEDMELYVGILPAESMDSGFGYNDYGRFIQKKIEVSSTVQEVSFIVPETGEYGIGVQHIKDDATTPIGANGTVTFALEINQKFENSLVVEGYNPNNTEDTPKPDASKLTEVIPNEEEQRISSKKIEEIPLIKQQEPLTEQVKTLSEEEIAGMKRFETGVETLISVKLSDERKFTPEEWQKILKKIESGEIRVEPESE